MRRILPAMLGLALAACSSSSSSSSSTTGNANGSGTGRGAGSATTTTTTGGGNGPTGGNGTTGGASATTGGGNGGAITVDNFNAALNKAYCTYELTCDEGSYAPYIINAICGSVTLLDDGDLPLAVDAGRVAFNTAEATACIDALDSTCTDLSTLPCELALAADGLVPPAGACYSDEDCLSTGCTGETASSCTPGTCLGIVGVGGACDCPNCGDCNFDAGLTCTNSICTEPSTVGQACGGSNPSCALGLDCVNAICTSVPIGAGNPCEFGNGDCASGSYCYQVAMASNGNCATKVAANQPCSEDVNHAENAFSQTDNECAGSHPVCLGAGTLMDAGVASGTCSTLQDVGGSCTPPVGVIDPNASYNDGCYAGLNCVGGACVKPPSSGMCSATGIACDLATSFCNSVTNICDPYIALGGSCNPNDSSPCGIGANCDSNDICQESTATPSCSPTL